MTSASYDAANRLTNWGTSALTYDNDGNLLSMDSATYGWNARNQLVATSDGGGGFAYDAFGRRVSRTVSGSTSTYLYDGLNPVLMNSDFLLSGLGLDESYARVTSSGTTSFITDALGSTVALTDGSGATTANYAYQPYGAASKTGTDDTPFQFTGRENDGASNLMYFRARYYSPQLGQFISSDPLGLAAGPNTYAYVVGDPISRVDPEGLYDCTYSILAHSMSCIPNVDLHPPYSSNSYVSGNNRSPGPVPCGCQNNPAANPYSDHGPLPMGNYTIGPEDGRHRRRLTPDPGTVTYGRHDFEIHGCANPAECSEGCIGATTNRVRDRLNELLHLEEGNNRLHVIF